MSGTGLHAALRDRYVEQPGWYAVRKMAREQIEGGEFDYTAALGQPFRNRWSEEEYAAFAILRAEIESGRLHIFRVPVGDEPSADREREENAAKLRAVKPPFEVHLDMRQNNSSDGDGSVRWSAPLELDDGATVVPAMPHWLPLEVGFSSASTTLWHTRHLGGVVRWPYDSEQLFVIRRVDDFFDLMDF